MSRKETHRSVKTAQRTNFSSANPSMNRFSHILFISILFYFIQSYHILLGAHGEKNSKIYKIGSERRSLKLIIKFYFNK